MDVHYFESHVTIAPVFGDQREQLIKLAARFKFRLAELLMRRNPQAAEASREDAFMTGRGYDHEELLGRTLALVKQLESGGYQVWRYKTESTLVDSRYNDAPYKLDRQRLPERERNPRSPV